MITVLHLRAMRLSMQEKLATRATQGPRNYEEMSKARWKQTAKDVPLVALGAGLGYAGGRLGSEMLAKHVLKSSPKVQTVVRQGLPVVGAMGSAISGYMFGQQRALSRQRRDEADALAKTNKSVKIAAKFTHLSDKQLEDLREQKVDQMWNASGKEWDASQKWWDALGDEENRRHDLRQAVDQQKKTRATIIRRATTERALIRPKRALTGAMLGSALGAGIGIARRDPSLMSRLGMGGAAIGGLGGALWPVKEKKAYASNVSAPMTAGPTVRNYPDLSRDTAKARRASRSQVVHDFYRGRKKSKDTDPGSTMADIPFRAGDTE